MPNPCPICNGEKRVWYGVNSERLRTPIRCRACDGTGRQLWPQPAARQDWDEYHRQLAESGKAGPTERTLIAIRHGRYRDYCRGCTMQGIVPATRRAWIRIRCHYRTHPDYQRGKTGPDGGRDCSGT